MTKIEYDELTEFPCEFVTLVSYRSENTNLKRGESFIGVKKQTIGSNDHSIVDSNGHPHYFEYCNLKIKE